jgi:hypothetical protein
MPKGYCPYCGMEIEGDFTYCPKCGKRLPSFEGIEERPALVSGLHRMELTDNIVASINFAGLLFKDLGTLIMLSILWPIPLLNLIATGYVYQVIQESPESEFLPPFRDYGRLWINGLKLAVTTFLYMLIPSLIITIVSANFILKAVEFSEGWVGDEVLGITEFLMRNLLVFIPLLIGSLLLIFAISIFLWMALVHSVKTGSLLKAFSIGELVQTIGQVGWGKYLIWLFVMFILGAIFGTIGRTPFVGWLLLLILHPPFYVFMARSASQIYSEGRIPDD